MADSFTAHRAEAAVATARASAYLQQLCKHFAHKLPVSFDAGQGRIGFPTGVCELDATGDPNALRLRVGAASAEDLARLEDVAARHLLRFAFREDLRIDWTRA